MPGSGGVVWLTGLSAAGKSTLAIEAESRLFVKGYQVYVLDGDNLRHGLNADLGFSPAALATGFTTKDTKSTKERISSRQERKRESECRGNPPWLPLLPTGFYG